MKIIIKPTKKEIKENKSSFLYSWVMGRINHLQVLKIGCRVSRPGLNEVVAAVEDDPAQPGVLLFCTKVLGSLPCCVDQVASASLLRKGSKL